MFFIECLIQRETKKKPRVTLQTRIQSEFTLI